MKAIAAAAGRDNVVRLRTRSPVQGLHLLGEWYGCPRTEAIKRATRLRAISTQLARASGFEVVSSLFQQFEPEGVVGTVLFSDAHFAVHTWPHTGFVAVDVYACHLNPSTRTKAHELLTRLRDQLRPVWVNGSEVSRGVPEGPDL